MYKATFLKVYDITPSDARFSLDVPWKIWHMCTHRYRCRRDPRERPLWRWVRQDGPTVIYGRVD
jgi:hypothetical protein